MSTDPRATPEVTPSRLEEAMATGRGLPLDGCVYGPPHWKGTFVDEAAPYYPFLAGFVRTFGVSRIMELGTHYGGSTLAMHVGLRPELASGARIVTVDVTRLNEEGLRRPGISRLTGDSLAPDIVAAAMRAFDGHIDVLYVDTVHTYRQTLENVAVYANRLKPRFIILDDIRLNPGMCALWEHLVSLHGDGTFDLSTLVERESAGFGLIACRYPFAWPEAAHAQREALRVAWSVRRAVSARTPEPLKVGFRRAMARMLAPRRS